MAIHEWVEEFPGAVTVCDREGIVLEMNEKAAQSFQKEGGKMLIGKNVLDCHQEPARSKLKRMLSDKEANIYTIQKEGIKKLIYQMPWYKGKNYGGIVELSLEIPENIPHFLRD